MFRLSSKRCKCGGAIVNLNAHHSLPIFNMVDILLGKSEAETKSNMLDILNIDRAEMINSPQILGYQSSPERKSYEKYMYSFEVF